MTARIIVFYDDPSGEISWSQINCRADDVIETARRLGKSVHCQMRGWGNDLIFEVDKYYVCCPPNDQYRPDLHGRVGKYIGPNFYNGKMTSLKLRMVDDNKIKRIKPHCLISLNEARSIDAIRSDQHQYI